MLVSTYRKKHTFLIGSQISYFKQSTSPLLSTTRGTTHQTRTALTRVSTCYSFHSINTMLLISSHWEPTLVSRSWAAVSAFPQTRPQTLAFKRKVWVQWKKSDFGAGHVGPKEMTSQLFKTSPWLGSVPELRPWWVKAHRGVSGLSGDVITQ